MSPDFRARAERAVLTSPAYPAAVMRRIEAALQAAHDEARREALEEAAHRCGWRAGTFEAEAVDDSAHGAQACADDIRALAEPGPTQEEETDGS